MKTKKEQEDFHAGKVFGIGIAFSMFLFLFLWGDNLIENIIIKFAGVCMVIGTIDIYKSWKKPSQSKEEKKDGIQ